MITQQNPFCMRFSKSPIGSAPTNQLSAYPFKKTTEDDRILSGKNITEKIKKLKKDSNWPSSHFQYI